MAKKKNFNERLENFAQEMNKLMDKWGILLKADPKIEEGVIKADIKAYDRHHKDTK